MAKNKKYKILRSFITAETITVNGKIIESGVRLGPGEEGLLENFSQVAIQGLTSKGFIAEVNANGTISIKENNEEFYNDNFLRGLIQPGEINRAIKLLNERKLSLPNLKTLCAKTEEVIQGGVDSPLLRILHDRLVEEIYNQVILNAD